MIHSQNEPRVLDAIFSVGVFPISSRVIDNQVLAILAKAKRILKWQRDPEGMRLRILEAAKQEFAAHGIAGARVAYVWRNLPPAQIWAYSTLADAARETE